MKRATKYALSVFLSTFLLCSGLIMWLVATPGGARWLMEILSRKAGIEVSIVKMEGSILTGLNIEGLQLNRSPMKVRIEDMSMRWQPISLLAGRLTIKELRCSGVTILDERPESKTPPDLSWPRVSGLPAYLHASIRSFTVNGFVYERLSKPPFAISVLSGRILWRRGLLDIRDVIVVTSSATVRGEASASLLRPSLSLDLAGDITKEIVGLKKVTIKARLVPADAPEQTSGPVKIVGNSSEGGLTEIAGEIGLTVSSLNLRKFSLKQSGRQGNISGEGDIVFSGDGPFLRLRARMKDIDLSPELRTKTGISGSLSFEGTPDRYQGNFSLANTGAAFYQALLSGPFQGDSTHVKLSSLKGSWLEGSLRGEMDVGWKELITLKGSLTGTGLDPARVSPDWSGVINFALEGDVRWPVDAPLEGHVSGRLLESRLRGRALRGEFGARLNRGDFVISALDLHGRGFDIHAAGELKKRINFAADIQDLSGLLPDTQGSLNAKGWLSLHEGIGAIEANGRGKALSAGGINISSTSFDLSLGDAKDRPLRFRSDIKGLTYGKLRLTSLFLEAKGTLSDHAIVAALHSPKAEAKASLQGSYQSDRWKGKILTLAGYDGVGRWALVSPADLHISSAEVSLSPIVITGNKNERFELTTAIGRQPRRGYANAVWKKINLSRIDRWLTGVDLKGETSGEMDTNWTDGALSLLKGSLNASGTLKTGEYSVSLSRAAAEVKWSKEGLLGSLELVFAEHGRFSGRVSSSAPVRAAVPERGEIKAEWQEINPSLFQSLLPKGTRLKGNISGRVNGNILPGESLDLSGSVSISKGSMSWQQGKQQFEAQLKTAAIEAIWRGEGLSGKLDLSLLDYGKAHAEFQLPLPARLPVSVDPKGAVHASIDGHMLERGLLTSIFPGLIQESHGEMDIALKAGGQWEKPDISGRVSIEKAGAYLPRAGTTLKGVTLSAHLAGDRIFIDSFSAESGPGNITGKAEILLQNWRPIEYQGSIKGKRFQTIYLPELRVMTNPDITFEGTVKQVSVRGDLVVPELLATETKEAKVEKPSSDVIIIDAQKKEKKSPPLVVDIRIGVTLGERVIVKARGLDVQLAGDVIVTANPPGEIKTRGVITVTKGKYSTYGVSLNITRGRVVFAGPPDAATLDMLAVRTVNDIVVGVLISGTTQEPVVKLYSMPAMTDSDVMSYIVLGHPLTGDSAEVSLVASAAGALLSGADSVSVQDQIKNRIGLDTLDVETGSGDISKSLVTVGKYLTPKLYVSYGRSLFTDDNLIRLRYKLSKKWEIESQSGAESGVDLFYKIEFR